MSHLRKKRLKFFAEWFRTRLCNTIVSVAGRKRKPPVLRAHSAVRRRLLMMEEAKPLRRSKKDSAHQTKFNPLALKTLAETMVSELLKQPVNPLKTLPPFEGPGVYSIYYAGPFPPYRPIASLNRNKRWELPIYVGKARFDRIRNHATSISQVSNLDINDFWCRYLVTEEVFIPLCEELLIRRYKPIWNIVITGFGPKVVGEKRITQQTSMWDMLHPGRPGRGAAPNKRFQSPEQIVQKLHDFFTKERISWV